MNRPQKAASGAQEDRDDPDKLMSPAFPGVLEATRWVRPEPRRIIAPVVVQQIIDHAFPGSVVLSVEALTEGFRNANFKVGLDSAPNPVVLRMYEHDPSLCRKEVDLLRVLRGSVPVPEVLYAQFQGTGDVPPVALLSYIEGITLRELKQRGRAEAMSQAAAAIGRTLAAIGRITFPKSGWLAPGPAATTPLLEGPDPLPRFVDLCLASKELRRRLDSDVPDRIHDVVWAWAPRLAQLDQETCLVHCDFGKRNLLVRNTGEGWTVAAVLDWEFAVAGSPLIDVGHLLRYETAARPLLEPHFSHAYLQAGASLPEDWRQLARIVDLSALCEMLTHEQLPESAEAELVELVCATVENRDPQWSGILAAKLNSSRGSK